MVNEGQAVRAGGLLLTIGSMNMETALVITGLDRAEDGWAATKIL